MQSRYNATLWCVRATIVAMEKQYVLHDQSVYLYPRYPACNAQPPYCHLWIAPLYTIFPHLINGMIFFKKKLLNINRVFRFSLQFLSETPLIVGRTQGDMIKKCTLVFM